MSRGQTAALYVHGRSGAGKTVLVQHFLSGLVARDAAVVLAGRCYEQESVPYKALDSLVDSLGRHLRRLSAPLVQALLPREVWPLTRVFPVLSRIEAVASLPRRTIEVTDPRELRRRAFNALRELLARLGDRGPLVLAIDDLQWGDADSAALLSELMRPPDPPVFLLLGCYRDEDAQSSPFLRALLGASERENKLPDRCDLAVDPLTESEARELASSLLGGADPDATVHAQAIARESGGNPFFVTELVRHISVGAELSGRSATREVTLDEVLWDRIRRLPVEARRFLEAVAVSGQPVRQASACRVAGLGADGLASLAVLRAGHLVRSAGPGSLDDVEVYHDRIRETVIKHLSPEVLKTWHGELARVLEDAGGADSETLAVHFEAAGTARDGREDITQRLPPRPPRPWPLTARPSSIDRPSSSGRPLTRRGDLCVSSSETRWPTPAAGSKPPAPIKTRPQGSKGSRSSSCRVAPPISSSSAATSTKDSRPSINCWPRSACGYPARRGVRC